MIQYVYVSNIMYNCGNIKPVRWWNRIFGFPGRVIVATVSLNMSKFTDESYRLARKEFEQLGLRPHVMGCNT